MTNSSSFPLRALGKALLPRGGVGRFYSSLLFFHYSLAGASAPAQPNIILFLVDDMGWQETSVPFWQESTPLNQRYRTPNMERMAQLGVRFTNAYACAVSSPSRCSLLSGMNAARHRVTNWTLHYNQSTDEPSSSLLLPTWHYNGIQPADASPHDLVNATRVTPLPQILKDHGYYTIHCGKAHFAAEQTAGADPLRLGFCVNIAGGANGAPASYLAENEYGSGPFHVTGLERYYGTGTFLTEALTLEAISQMEQAVARRQPFFLYLSHYAIHIPYDADRRFTPNYREVVDPMLGVPLDEQEINHAALVEGMDKSLGDILDYLQLHPDVARNTILLFMSDNGGQSVDFRQGRKNLDQNFPARAGKGSALEGGIHEPMMVLWPGVTRGGSVNANRVIIEDFFPTLLSMAGIRDYHTVQHVDGVDFTPLLLHPRRRHQRTLLFHFPNVWVRGYQEADGFGAYSALLQGDHHLIYFWASRQFRLYNRRRDIAETHDLSETHPRLLRRLAQQLTDSLMAMQAQRPSDLTGSPVPWPIEALTNKNRKK